MISARTAFQIYKEEGDDTAGVSTFNGLAAEVSLPFKVRAAEEALVASLNYVEENKEEEKYSVSVLHSASSYLTLLASYLPTMARSQAAQKVDVNFNAVIRTAMLYAKDPEVLKKVKDMIMQNHSSGQVSNGLITDIEGSVLSLEKLYRQQLKEAGKRVEMLRKVAPERPVRVSTTPALTQQEDTEGRDSKNVSPTRKRRSRSKSAAGEGAETEEEGGIGDAMTLKAPKLEEDTMSLKRKAAAAARTSAAKARSNHFLVWGRLRGLTNGEKKAVTALNHINTFLAHIYANKYNNLVPVFDLLMERVKDVQVIIDAERAAYEAKEDKKPPEPFHETTLDGLRAALNISSHMFREDEECRYEFDEDLLHPIAHACLTVINQIEGYSTHPFPEMSEKDKAKKAAARAAAKTKREEVQRRLMERAKAREELAKKREEEKRLVRQRLGGGDVDESELVPDHEVVNPVQPKYVHYEATLPLGSVELYEQALFIWAMISSVPVPLLLSQMPFALFVKGLLLENESDNGLMEEVTRCLLAVSMEHVRVSSPNAQRIATRGKNWFDALVEFVGVASGNKKKRQQQRRKSPTPFSGELDSSEDDGDSSSGDSSSDSSSSPIEEEEEQQDGGSSKGEDEKKPEEEEEAAAAPVEPEETLSGFDKQLKETMDEIAELRTNASWGNVGLNHRLNLLQFCVQEALASDLVRTETEKLLREHEEDAIARDRRLKEIRDEAEKELKALHKSGSAEEYEVKKQTVLNDAATKRQKAIAKSFGRQDEKDIGAIIEPLGMDRFKRLYWHFPMERVIHVQATPSSAANIPFVPTPPELKHPIDGSRRLLDDEDEMETTKTKSTTVRGSGNHYAVNVEEEGESQRVWGTIPCSYLPTFVTGLDTRGENEAMLAKVLKELAPYLETIEKPQEGRSTRSRSNTFGYLNRLKEFF